MNERPLDLSRLAMDRAPTDSVSSQPQRGKGWSRYGVPGGILLGFVALLSTATGLQLTPRTSVTVVPVIVRRAASQPSGASLFQAAGWIEPRPTSVSVPALTAGIIESLSVVEGQEVERGETIAQLISVDAELAVEQARAMLALREAELQRTQAELTAAKSRVENPLHLKSQRAEAEGLLARSLTDREKLPFLIRAAEANLAYARKSLDGKQSARGAVSGVVVHQAERDYAAAQAELEELQRRGPNLEREIAALKDQVDVLDEQLQLLIEERKQVAEAEAKLAAAVANREEARLQQRKAELALQRTRITAPMTGRILRLIAFPGSRVMGLEHTAGKSSSTVVEMYDPSRLQVRADVRLEDVPLVAPGALVRIETASSAQSIMGRVLQPTSTANIQKNTLEVKVELLDPPQTIRPEMLVTATFLAPEPDRKADPATQPERLFVPQQLIMAGEADSFVWVVDAQGQAARRSVSVGNSGPNGLVEITRGLNPTDKLIASGTADLRPGESVVIRGEDPVIGVER